MGERTEERGFAAGFIIEDGRLEVDFGGGVSQLATTTFNAAFFAGLEIVEHNPHSFYISRYPEGRESTIAWGVKDLRFRNDSDARHVRHDELDRQLGDGAGLGHQALPDRVGDRRRGTTSSRSRSSTTRGRAGVEPGDLRRHRGRAGLPGRRDPRAATSWAGAARWSDSEVFRTKYDPEHEVVCGTAGPPTAEAARSGWSAAR